MQTFLFQLLLAQPLRAVGKLQASGGQADSLELVGHFSILNWSQLSLVADALEPVIASALDVQRSEVERRQVLRGALPSLSASIDFTAPIKDRERATLAFSAAARFVESVQIEEANGSLFAPPAMDLKTLEPLIGEQRRRLLTQVGGKIVKSPMLIRADDFPPLPLRGRWARLQTDDTVEERAEVLDGYVDGFWYSPRRFFIADAAGRAIYPVQFDESRFLHLICTLCAEIRSGVRPKCTFDVVKQSARRKTTYLLRNITRLTPDYGIESPALDLAMEVPPSVIEEAAMA